MEISCVLGCGSPTLMKLTGFKEDHRLKEFHYGVFSLQSEAAIAFHTANEMREKHNACRARTLRFFARMFS